MKQINVSLSVIEDKANQLAENEMNWHFHILTQDCSLNTHSRIALILENQSADECYVSLCDEKPMAVGKRLVEILHGKEITNNAPTIDLTPDERRIADRAKQLSDSGIAWHHHMLFPNCCFNPHKNRWTIILEDRANGTVLESISDKEPKAALRQIESIFYAQKL